MSNFYGVPMHGLIGSSYTTITSAGQQGIYNNALSNTQGGISYPLISTVVNIPPYQGPNPMIRVPGFNVWFCPCCKKEFDQITDFRVTWTINKNNPLDSRAFACLCLVCWRRLSPPEKLPYYSQQMKYLCMDDPEYWKELSAAVWAGE